MLLCLLTSYYCLSTLVGLRLACMCVRACACVFTSVTRISKYDLLSTESPIQPMLVTQFAVYNSNGIILINIYGIVTHSTRLMFVLCLEMGNYQSSIFSISFLFLFYFVKRQFHSDNTLYIACSRVWLPFGAVAKHN